ncbi:MAG TPA: DUF4153 domain-containing protein [Gracilimonas sp.]|uniref:DUF4153 domain-containing protein n=1 Tax=Gracilimonas sp. TaxID=1974203 RepID=UPI002DA6A37D|nr:DUF4153 domain-containing protein [Gracilimonas sp.]
MKIKFPSIGEISEKGTDTFKRFPFALSIAAIGTISAIWLADVSWGQKADYFYLLNLCWISALSISVFVSITTFSESLGWNFKKAVLLKAGTLFILALYYYLLPEEFSLGETESFYRYSLFFLSAHLLVSFAPFLKSGDVEDFWAYNKTLFLRILTALLYSMVLFAGLSIAMLSLENLLEINISGRRYSQLWILLVGLFNTWFFLAGIPHPKQISQRERKYPGGLKVFVQYILIPLITVYILILYLYTGKIILEWQWPNGWVANLVLSFSIAGILALLLLYPIRNQEKNRWIHLFSKGYYIALIPLIILLMLSIWVRISEYGVTVNRYFVAALAVWLTGIVIYFLIARSKNIKVIPISLCVISILISFGPLGAFEVSKRSQLDRFEGLLEKNGLLSQEKKVVKSQSSISFDDRKQISSKVAYILELEGTEPLQPYFKQDLEEVMDKEENEYRYNDAGKITDLMGIEFVSEWQTDGQAGVSMQSFYYYLESNKSIPVSGYSLYLGEFTFNTYNQNNYEVEIEGVKWVISYNAEDDLLNISSDSTEKGIDLKLTPLINRLKALGGSSQDVPDQSVEMMTLEAEDMGVKVKVVLKNISGIYEGDGVKIQNLTAAILIDTGTED